MRKIEIEIPRLLRAYLESRIPTAEDIPSNNSTYEYQKNII